MDPKTGNLDGPVSLKTATTPGQQHKQWVLRVGSPTSGLGGSQGHTWPRCETSAKDEAKHNKEKGLEGVAAE
jgi:hypothetical protein